ncbi:DUF2612 domain-containing protein [Singulisphaera rosea]
MPGDIQDFDFSVDLLKALLWQYDEAANLQALLEDKANWYEINQSQFWRDWIANVFDLRTADEFGLSVWSIILGLPLFVNNNNDVGPFFGFDSQTGVNFDNGIFGDENTYELPTEIKRIALQLRYFQLTGSGTVPETNRMLKYVFRNFGPAWLVDDYDMTQYYFFAFPLTFDLKYLFNNYDILPRPAGVQSTWTDTPDAFFGFAIGDYNFDNGNFGE